MSQSSRPNFLLITTDQQRFDTLRAAGNQSIWTPHLDWLCDTGIRFSNCYADSPICAASRATIMTGQHAWHHGQLGNGGISPMSRLPTLPGTLTEAGYQTRAIGKMHFHPMQANYGFEHIQLLTEYYREMQRYGGPQPKEHGVGENEMVPVMTTTDETRTSTHWTTQASIDFLESRDPTRPFMLWSSFTKPHPPFDAPLSYWEIYDGITLPEPVFGDWSQDPDQVPLGFAGPTRMLNNIDRFSPEQVMAARRAYYACISHVDYNLGLLFARLREMDLLENTWIIFTSDHGEMLGDHHLGAKTIFCEGASHIPFLVRPPSGSWSPDERAGSVDDRLACLADLMPTILAEAGVAAPAGCDGNSLFGEERRETLIGACDKFHMVLDRGWKYQFCEEGGDELLFHLPDDPMEQKNCMKSHPDEAGRLRGVLNHSLRERKHPAAGEKRPEPTKPMPTIAQQRSKAWPGFHHPSIRDADILH